MMDSRVVKITVVLYTQSKFYVCYLRIIIKDFRKAKRKLRRRVKRVLRFAEVVFNF